MQYFSAAAAAAVNNSLGNRTVSPPGFLIAARSFPRPTSALPPSRGLLKKPPTLPSTASSLTVVWQTGTLTGRQAGASFLKWVLWDGVEVDQGRFFSRA